MLKGFAKELCSLWGPLPTGHAQGLGRRLLHGAFWSLSSAVFSRLLGFAAFMIVARTLGKEGLGQFAVIQSTIGMFGIFAGFGLGQTATKYVAEFRDKNPGRAGQTMTFATIAAICFGGAAAALLYVCAPWIAANIFRAPELAPLLCISSLVLFFEAMNGAQLGAISGLEAFRTSAKITMWVSVVNLPALSLGAWLYGVEGAVWGLAATRALNWYLSHFALRILSKKREIPFLCRTSREEIRLLWRYSLPAMLGGLAVSPAIWACNAMLVNQPHGFEQMGILQAVNSLQQIILFLGTSLGVPLLPILASAISSGRNHEYLSKINVLSTWLLGAVPSVILFGAPEIVQAGFGKDYAGIEFLQSFAVMTLCTNIIMYKQGLSRAIAARGFMVLGMVDNYVWAACVIFFAALFTTEGAIGYAIAFALAYVTNSIIFIPIYLKKQLIPRNTMLSKEAACIWFVLLAGVSINLLQISLPWRLIYIPLALLVIARMFFLLLSDPKNKSGSLLPRFRTSSN